MARNGSGVYSLPAGTKGVSNNTIESAKYNSFLDDLVADLNAERPISAGGTGATTAAAALLALGVTTGPSMANEVEVASAATCNILGASAWHIHISGTTTITSLGTGTNKIRIVRFSGALTLTHDATSLILPGGADITTVAGDTMIVESDASSNARVTAYQTVDGRLLTPLDTNGHQVRLSRGSDVATAGTVHLGNDGNYFELTGSTTVTNFATKGVGTTLRLRAANGGFILVNSSDLVCPGDNHITTQAGDMFDITEFATGQWRISNYQVASRTPGAGRRKGRFVKTDAFTTSSLTPVDVTNLTLTFTAEAGRTYNIRSKLSVSCTNDSLVHFRIVRSAGTDVPLDIGVEAGVRERAGTTVLPGGNGSACAVVEADDSPSAGSVTYTVQMFVSGGTGWINANANDVNDTIRYRDSSFIEITEVSE